MSVDTGAAPPRREGAALAAVRAPAFLAAADFEVFLALVAALLLADLAPLLDFFTLLFPIV
jgi:hypothetical protein